MSTVQLKGLAVRSVMDWIVRNKGRAVLDEVLGRLSAVDRESVASTLPSSWCPIPAVSSLFDSYAHSSACPANELEAQFRQIGNYVAESNLTTIYRVLLTFVKPSGLADHLPRLWGTYFKGVQTSIERLSENRARNIATPLGEFKYFSPAVVGWFEFAYKHVGSKHVSIVEKNFSLQNVAPNELDIHLEWS